MSNTLTLTHLASVAPVRSQASAEVGETLTILQTPLFFETKSLKPQPLHWL